jgi:phosphoribosylaminoimidazole-succinocarboxamide synthase
MNTRVVDTNFPDLKLFKKGKVRDVYDLGATLLMVATDRISAFDVVMPNPIPDKGKILNQISLFWFEKMKRLHIRLGMEILPGIRQRLRNKTARWIKGIG